MKCSLPASLAIALLGSALVGCTTAPSEDCQPGDIDCASSSGKEDGFDFRNDPVRMSQHLNYRIVELPKQGWRNDAAWRSKYPEAVGKAEVAWADTYWPTTQGSHNVRWLGQLVKSPLEKYDQAFNGHPGCAYQPTAMYGSGAKAAWDTYYGCAGPASKWQAIYYEQGGFMHDGIDNDGDGMIDEYGMRGIDGIESWRGTCHAWTPASMLVPEPQHAVTFNGVRFEVGDIKALIQNVFDRTEAIMLGGRCNSREITHDVEGSANDNCADVNPGALHVVMTNFLGLAQLPLIEDRTANYQVWNQPVVGYEVTKQVVVTPAEANACVGATGTTWKYNEQARELYEVRMTVSYVFEGDATQVPVGYRQNIALDLYHYILEISDTGKIIGGRYCSGGENSHIDFLWAPTASFAPSNPHVDVDAVLKLVKLAIAP